MSAKRVGKWVAGSRSRRSLGIDDRPKLMPLQRRSGLTAESISPTAGGLVWCRSSIDSLGSLLDWTGLAWLVGAPSLGLKSDRRWYKVQPGSCV